MTVFERVWSLWTIFSTSHGMILKNLVYKGRYLTDVIWGPGVSAPQVSGEWGWGSTLLFWPETSPLPLPRAGWKNFHPEILAIEIILSRVSCASTERFQEMKDGITLKIITVIMVLLRSFLCSPKMWLVDLGIHSVDKLVRVREGERAGLRVLIKDH